MGHGLEGRPTVGQVPMLIFAYLALSLFISGFIMTVLAYAPADSYLMNMLQTMGIMNFIGPIVLIIGAIMLLVAIFYCTIGTKSDSRDDDDYYDE